MPMEVCVPAPASLSRSSGTLETSLNHISGVLEVATLADRRVSKRLSSILEELRRCENENRLLGLPISPVFNPPPKLAREYAHQSNAEYLTLI
jgi:hypothetical protein